MMLQCKVFVEIRVYKHGWVLGAKCLYDLESWWPQTLPESAQMLEHKNPKIQKSEKILSKKRQKGGQNVVILQNYISPVSVRKVSHHIFNS